MGDLNLTFRQRLTFLAHLWKAYSRQHHLELAPLFQTLIPADGIVLDVGTHAGQFAKLFAGIAPEGHVYGFEPGAYPRAIASRVLRWKGLHNVTLHAFGLGEAEATLSLSTPLKASGSLGFGLAHIGSDESDTPVRRETIHIKTVDGFIAEQSLDRVDFIKADIEGHEGPMLRGAQHCLETHKPALLIEMQDSTLNRSGDSRQSLLHMLQALEYVPYGICGNGKICADISRAADILFVHKSKADAAALAPHLLG